MRAFTLVVLAAAVVGCTPPKPKPQPKPLAEATAPAPAAAPQVADAPTPQPPPEPPPAAREGPELGALAERLEGRPPDEAARIAAAGLAEVEGFPDFLGRALRDFAEVPPQERPVVVSREIMAAEGQAAWDRACAGGVVAFQRVAVADPADKARLLYQECGLAERGAFDEAAMASADPWGLLLAIVAADQLGREEAQRPASKAVLGALLGGGR